MKIIRDKDKERWLLDRVKAWLNKYPRTGIHVSDLLFPRKTYWRRVDPKEMSDDEAGYFIAGRGHHEVIETIVDPEAKRKGTTDAGTFEWEEIFYSPDIRLPHPTEIKTSRAQYGPKDDELETLKKEYATYLKQLFSYMAIEGDKNGDLVVFYLSLKDKERGRKVPQFRWYRVELTDEEIEKMRGNLKAAKLRLETALETKDHRALPVCPVWLCKDCPWLKPCDPKNTNPKKGTNDEPRE